MPQPKEVEPLIHQGKLIEAKALLDQQLKAEPNCGWAYAYLADIGRRENDYFNAEKMAIKAMEADPNHMNGFKQATAIFTQNGKYQEANDAGHKAFQLNPNEFPLPLLQNYTKWGKNQEMVDFLKNSCQKWDHGKGYY